MPPSDKPSKPPLPPLEKNPPFDGEPAQGQLSWFKRVEERAMEEAWTEFAETKTKAEKETFAAQLELEQAKRRGGSPLTRAEASSA